MGFGLITDFGINGLWPNYRDGSYPSNCDPNNSSNQDKVLEIFFFFLFSFFFPHISLSFGIKIIANFVLNVFCESFSIGLEETRL